MLISRRWTDASKRERGRSVGERRRIRRRQASADQHTTVDARDAGVNVCAVRVLVVGKLFSDTLKSMVFVALLIVITAVPRAVLSAFVIGGTSFSADSCTVKMVMSLGVVGVLLVAASRDTDRQNCYRCQCQTLHRVLLVAVCRERTPARDDGEADALALRPHQLPAQVESHVDVVRAAAARDHSRRGVEVVAEVELQHVAARQLLDADVPRRAIGPVAVEARRDLRDDRDRFADARAHAQADEHRVVRVLAGNLLVVVRLRRRRDRAHRARSCSVGVCASCT